MKNVLLSVIVVAVLIAGGISGTFAGFVDTEVSHDNYVQAGISDLLVNGENDPNVDTKVSFDHASPSKSIDFWVDLYNWGKCNGGDVYMMFKDCESREAGFKNHMGANYVFDGIASGNGSLPDGVPFGYRPPTGVEPLGAGVATSEPELGAEEGNFYIAQTLIDPDEPGVMGVDYATGVGQHLGVHVEVPLEGASGNNLGDPDTDDDGLVSAEEYAAWLTNGNRWETITSLTGKLIPTIVDGEVIVSGICGNKDFLGFLRTQEMTFVHIDVVIQQIEDPLWGTAGRDYDQDGDSDAADAQLRWWPTNALQGDIAEWDMMFELTTDP